MKYFSTFSKSDSALSQYESLRTQVLNRPDCFLERSLGLALFIHRGMLAWIEICHRCISVNANQEKRPVTAAFADETTSEMIKVMANITLFNLEEALSKYVTSKQTDIEAIRWIENHGRHQRGSALYRDDCLEKSFPL